MNTHNERALVAGEGLLFLRKWILVGALVGLGAGLASLIFLALIDVAQDFLLGTLAGYTPPKAAGEGGLATWTFSMARPWALPLIMGGAGLVGGLIVWRVAPTTHGIGTNAAIDAFHQNKRIGPRVPMVKLLTSALTIGAGMTSGREGPIAQTGAGIGAALANALKLTARERNIALAAGLGAGVASIFKAPLAGALIGAEIFYKEDFEVEALVPSVIASVVGYSVVGSVMGFDHIFSLGPTSPTYEHPTSLLLYALLGVVCALAARLLVTVFFPIQRAFARFPIPVATTIGGLATGLVALLVPAVMGSGYGWVQLALLSPATAIPPTLSGLQPATALLVAALAVMLTASLTLGSGNSGGIFGPSIFIGAMIGGAFGLLTHELVPDLVDNPAKPMIVGMGAFFAAAASAPISTIVMITEMTGGYGLLAPAMFAVVTAFLLAGGRTIFPSQVRSRLESPYHADEFRPLQLRRHKARDVMTQKPLTVGPDWPVSEALNIMAKAHVGGLPVIEDHKLKGIITRRDVLRVREEARQSTDVAHAMSSPLIVAHPNEDLLTLLQRMITREVGHLPIVDRDAPTRLLGLVARADIGRVLHETRETQEPTTKNPTSSA